jgi:hypothetical protein
MPQSGKGLRDVDKVQMSCYVANASIDLGGYVMDWSSLEVVFGLCVK